MTTSIPPRIRTEAAERLPEIPSGVFALSFGLASVASVAAAVTFFVDGVLTGPAVMNGSARGTALVMLLLAVPALLIAMSRATDRSRPALLVWMGSLFYLAYNGFLLLFLTPFNRLFLLYVATFSLSVFGAVALFTACDMAAVARRLGRFPARGLAVYAWVILTLNLIAWLLTVAEAMLADDPTSFLEGTGVATNAVFIQDLAFWLPLAAVAAWWLWQRRPIGVFLVGSWLVYGLMESIGVAVDQWFGHRADPASSLVSEGAMGMFVVLAVIGLAPLYFLFRDVRRSGEADPGTHDPARSMS